MFFKSMTRADMESAEALWQSNEGAARQECLAKLFMTSANEAFHKLSNETPDGVEFHRRVKSVVHLAMRDFKREHFLEVTLPDHEYYLDVRLNEPIIWFMPPSYTLAPSTKLRQLFHGSAPVRIHSAESPYYTSGYGNWDKYVEEMTKNRRFAYLWR